MLDALDPTLDEDVVRAWRDRVQRARAQLDWPDGPLAVRPHLRGTMLAFAAPVDQLFTATEVNEWALCASLRASAPVRYAGLEEALAALQPEALEPPVLDDAAAFARFGVLAQREARPALRRLVAAAAEHDEQALLDDTTLTLGSGRYSRSWSLDALPAVDAVAWQELGRIPTALVTGSNGKTTTVRLLAACARAHGWPCGFSCTDGLYVDDAQVATGDYSGPTGARLVLRDPRIAAAVLESARGGILRRGLAMTRADVAVVTNVSADHFGEYGVDDLDTLADVKLAVARVLGPAGTLVLNANDGTLRQRNGRFECRTAWFGLDADHPLLQRERARGGTTCGVREGQLVLETSARTHDLGAIVEMPLTVEATATYNVANLAAAALAAVELGIAVSTVARTFASFGAHPADNAGRLMRYELGGLTILMDYAHNPAGLTGVLDVATHLRSGGRLALLLGQAGNRSNVDMQALAQIAVKARPELVVVKEIDGYQRGRAEGETAKILHAALLRNGLRPDAAPIRLREIDAARCALEWARAGDVLVLLVHSLGARAGVSHLLEQLRTAGWRAGEPLPP